MAFITEGQVPRIRMVDLVSDPSEIPAAGYVYLYVEGGVLKLKDESENITVVGEGAGGGSGSSIVYSPDVATDWSDRVGVAPDDVTEALDFLMLMMNHANYLYYSVNETLDWDVEPTQVKSALDELASRVRAIEVA